MEKTRSSSGSHWTITDFCRNCEGLYDIFRRVSLFDLVCLILLYRLQATSMRSRWHYWESPKDCHFLDLLEVSQVVKCRFGWQAWRLVRLRGDGYRVESGFAWRAQGFRWCCMFSTQLAVELIHTKERQIFGAVGSMSVYVAGTVIGEPSTGVGSHFAWHAKCLMKLQGDAEIDMHPIICIQLRILRFYPDLHR